MIKLGIAGDHLVVKEEGKAWRRTEWSHNPFFGGYVEYEESEVAELDSFHVERGQQTSRIVVAGEIVGNIGPRLLAALEVKV